MAKIEEWVEFDDHFYLNQVGTKEHLQPMKKRDFGYCAECRAEDEHTRARRERYVIANSKLIGMELFSGKITPSYLCLYAYIFRCRWIGYWDGPLGVC